MPAIGYVNKLDDGSYRGTLRTLSISAARKIMPNNEKKPDSAQPDFRVYANGAEIGGAWIRQTELDLPQADDIKINDRAPVMRTGGSVIELAAMNFNLPPSGRGRSSLSYICAL